MRPLVRLTALLALAALPWAVSAQTMARLATSPAVLGANAVFFHNRTVAIVAMPALVEGIWRLPVDPPRSFLLTWRDGPPSSSGSIEIRGLFFDVGRFAPDDSRLDASGIGQLVRLLTRGQWPARETFFAITGATWTVPPPTTDTSLRAVVLAPARFDGQTVTVRGRFRGQNLFGDVPSWPRQSQWDFVLQAGDAALWVTGLRPRGKDFDLDPKARRDTTHFLEVTGTVKIVQGLPTIAATALKSMPPADEPPDVSTEPPPPPPPAPEVVFSAPTSGETDVAPSTTVRIQFSRDMREASFDNHVHVRYGAPSQATPPKFTRVYRASAFALELRFDAPLAPFTSVTVELGEGIVAKDGRPLAPTAVTFTTGSGRR